MHSPFSPERFSLRSFASILQTTDPLFPIGSYAHSYGLEELAASGSVDGPETLLAYLRDIVFLNLRSFELPYLRFAYQAWSDDDFDAIPQLDREIDASKISKEIRNASATQGVQRLRLIRKLRPSRRTERLSRLKADGLAIPHHLVVFAAEYIDLNAPLDATLAAWAYQTLAAPCAASLKLIRIGQEGAQSVLTEALRDLESVVSQSLAVERDFAGAFLPVLDVAAHRHERAYARLFIS